MIDVTKREHKSAEYLAINPAGAIPAMKEVDADGTEFILVESHAILRYLCDSREVDDHWYPKDLRARAKVDAYLDSHHSTLRAGMTGYISRVLFGGGKYTEDDLKMYVDKYVAAWKSMDDTLSKQAYLAGETISIADLSAIMELEQGIIINADLTDYPNLKAWKDKVFEEQPKFLAACKTLHDFAASRAAKE